MSFEFFNEIQNAIHEKISKVFEGRLFIAEEDPAQSIKTMGNMPICLIELVDFDKEDHRSDGIANLRLRFEARIFIKKTENPGHRLLIRNLACEMLLFIDQNDFDVKNISQSRNVTANDDALYDDFPRYESWVITWEATMSVGLDRSQTWQNIYPNEVQSDVL